MNALIERLKNISLAGYGVALAVLAIFGLTAFFVVARTVNTTPSQCASCHPEMTELWRVSKTHPAARVTCHECHADHAKLPEGFNIGAYIRDVFIPEKYMASETRLNDRCLGCHKDIPNAKEEKSKLIKINHKVHLEKALTVEGREVKLACVSCHGSVTHDRTARPTNRPLMQDCFTSACHAKDRNADNCLRCHYQSLLHKVMAEGEKKPEEHKGH